MTSDTHPGGPVRVAAIFDDGGSEVGQLLADFCTRQRSAGRSVLGVVMRYRDQGPDRKRAMILIDIDSGTEYPVSQPLGTGAGACQLDPRGFADASAVFRDALRRAPEIVVCNRFGGLEAAGGGFADELLVLMASGIPVLTVVSEPYVAAWRTFSGNAPLLPPEPDAWLAWLSAVVVHDRQSAG